MIVSFYILNLYFLFIHSFINDLHWNLLFQKSFFTFIFFICGFVLDLSLLNEFGPHLFTFMILILFLNLIQKNLLKFSSQKILLFIIFILAMYLYLLKKYTSFLLYNYSFDLQ